MKKVDLQKLRALLASRTDVVFAVSFGSAQKGLVGPESDFDIGIYFDPAPGTEELAGILSQISDCIEYDFIDFTDLKNAEPILAFEAISGVFLCKNDPHRTAEFCSLVCREYEDLMGELKLPA